MADYPNKNFDRLRLSRTFYQSRSLFYRSWAMGWSRDKIEKPEDNSVELQSAWELGADMDNLLKD